MKHYKLALACGVLLLAVACVRLQQVEGTGPA